MFPNNVTFSVQKITSTTSYFHHCFFLLITALSDRSQGFWHGLEKNCRQILYYYIILYSVALLVPSMAFLLLFFCYITFAWSLITALIFVIKWGTNQDLKQSNKVTICDWKLVLALPFWHDSERVNVSKCL